MDPPLGPLGLRGEPVLHKVLNLCPRVREDCVMKRGFPTSVSPNALMSTSVSQLTSILALLFHVLLL